MSNDSNETNDKPTVLIGVPLERTINQFCFHPFIQIARRGYDFIPLPYTRNDIARNKMATALLASEYDYLLMLDSDHNHPVNIVERLMRWVIANPSVRVVAGLNFRRGAPYEPCVFIEGGDGQVYTMSEWQQGLIEVNRAVGSGSLLVHRSVFEQIEEPWFTYEYDGYDGKSWPGTDMSFCQRLREHGIKMFVDTTTSSPHLIENWVTEQTYRSYLQANADRVAAATPYETAMASQGEVGDDNVWSVGDVLLADIQARAHSVQRKHDRRARILEFGSGASTVKLRAFADVVSVEHDPKFLPGGAFCKVPDGDFINAPLTADNWYNADIVKEALRSREPFDIVLIDGPSGSFRRKGILRHLDLLPENNVVVFVDDVNRPNEKKVLETLSKFYKKQASSCVDSAGREYGIIVA